MVLGSIILGAGTLMARTFIFIKEINILLILVRKILVVGAGFPWERGRIRKMVPVVATR